jgi:hypothetical protein
VQELSSPGIMERHNSLSNMWHSYPVAISIFFLIITVSLCVNESRKSEGSFFKLIIYGVISLILIWRIAINI